MKSDMKKFNPDESLDQEIAYYSQRKGEDFYKYVGSDRHHLRSLLQVIKHLRIENRQLKQGLMNSEMCAKCGWTARWEEWRKKWHCDGCQTTFTVDQFWNEWKKAGKKLGWHEWDKWRSYWYEGPFG